MKKVWVIGAGQLGRMMQYAAAPLGVQVKPVNVDDEQLAAPQFSSHSEKPHDEVVTAERELWPQTPSAKALQQHPNFKNKTIFSRLADRKTQKELLDSLSLATAKWLNVDNQTNTEKCHRELGSTCLLKRRTGGYDGRGQLWLRQEQNTILPNDWANNAIAEEKCNFDEEVSLVGARTHDGTLVFYPLTLNLHVDGILMASIAPLPRLHFLQSQAEKMLGSILEELDYVGVMAMECFRIGDKLIINELAPRVHNSGHWTQAGTTINQFEMHIRAICNLPLPVPLVRNTTLMINLIGIEKDERWLNISEVQLHWYNKAVRPGRKLGHININNTDISNHIIALDRIEPWLSENYAEVIDWLRNSLENL